MSPELAATLERVRAAFVAYPRRPVLEGCPHCRGLTVVDEHDLYSLTISLGGTVGTREDVKSLLPLLLERLVSSDELDPDIVLALLGREAWRTWPTAEQHSIEDYLLAVWRELLVRYPSPVGSFRDAADFLTAAGQLDQGVWPFLEIWDTTDGSAADRLLAELVAGWVRGAPLPAAAVTWLHRQVVRDRLHAGFERDHGCSWADDLAQGYDFLAHADR
jgi:hypothetical protein